MIDTLGGRDSQAASGRPRREQGRPAGARPGRYEETEEETMKPFDFYNPTRIIFGDGTFAGWARKPPSTARRPSW